PDPANDRDAARETIVRLIELSRRGDNAAALELFTDQARPQVRKEGGPDPFLARPGETFEVGDAVVTGDRADVPVTVREAGRDQHMVFKLRRQGADWRVYGFTAQFLPDDPTFQLTIDFENPQNTAKELFGADLEAMGKEWAKEWQQNLNQGFEDSFK